MQMYAPDSSDGQKHCGHCSQFRTKCSPFLPMSIDSDGLMARNGNLTSDLREAISEVGRLLAPLTSNTFEELSTSSQEVPQVNRPTS